MTQGFQSITDLMTMPMRMPMAGLNMAMDMISRTERDVSATDLLKNAMSMITKPQDLNEQVTSMMDMLRSQLLRAGSTMTSIEGVAAFSLDVYRYAVELLGQTGQFGNMTLATKELQNKMLVFNLVIAVDKELDTPKDERFELQPFIEKCYAMDDFQALWALEGLGHRWATSFLNTNEPPSKIMYPEQTGVIPAKTLLMLHAGMGLSFAEHLLGGLSSVSIEELKPKVQQVIDLCLDNSLEGYEGAALESMGLFVRTFNTNLMDQTDRVLKALETAIPVRDYFWRGMGRALYFSPESFLPLVNQRQFEWARRETPDLNACRNAFAGLAWAYAMVQLKNPEIIHDLVVQPLASQLEENPGFSNGIQSALIMRKDTTPEATFNRNLIDFDGGDQWDKLVARPARIALDEHYPRLLEAKQLGNIFRYHQDLSVCSAKRSIQ